MAGRPLGGFYGMVSSDPAFGPKEATSSGLDTDLWELARVLVAILAATGTVRRRPVWLVAAEDCELGRCHI